MNNRRGTEKPIEIFVALFIILSIALIAIKFFQAQVDQKEQELSAVQHAQQSRQFQESVRAACQQKCTDASNNGCSQTSLASLCAFGSRDILTAGQYIDLNNNNNKDIDTTLLAGIGVCEDHLYCFHLVDSCCARQITPETCKDILDNYWTSKGLSTEVMLPMHVPSGIPDSCQPNSDVKNWNDQAFVGESWQ